ncbi:hypothetical protein [Pseudomonas retamae]|uniref:Uncharacterized protein n=1 Tax=Pseudomonas retamae TaxID=702110 RepID=A0ABW7D449_9PSED
MTTLTAADLYPARIPSATRLETPGPYHGGIAIHSIAAGLLTVIIDPWLNQTKDDKCELYWDNDYTPVDTFTIPDNVAQEVRFQISGGLITDGSAKVFYTVERFPQEPVKSVELLMWVKLTRPGGDDDGDSEPGHSGLKYELMPDPSKGVDATMAKGGIRMLIDRYRYIAPYDRIFAKWGDEEITHYPVTQLQIDDPDNNPLFLTFTEEVIKRQGNGRDIPVSFRVADRVGNLTDPRDPWAKYTYVSVDLTERLAAPLIRFNNQTVTTIDLAQLGSSDLTVRVYFTSPHFQQNDEVRLTWTGTPQQGQPIVIGPLSTMVDEVPGHFDFTIPNASVKPLGGGSAKAKYQLFRGAQPIGVSNDAPLDVIGEASQLEPPTVPEAPDYELDPNVHQAGFTVVFDNLKLNANDELELEVAGRPGEGSVPPEKKVIAAGQTKVEFKIHFSITGANLQRVVLLKYRVISGAPAQTQELRIGELRQSSMPMPLLEGFDGDVLDVGLIKDDTKVLCGAWPFQCVGCPIWLKYVETFAGGGERVKEQFLGVVHDQAAGLSYTTEVQWLRECKDDSAVSIVLKVGLFVGAGLGDAVECRGRVYSIRAGFDDLTDFTNFQWNNWMSHYWGGGWKYDIVKDGDEFFLSPVKSDGFWQILVGKIFYELDIFSRYSFSFDYRATGGARYSVDTSIHIPVNTDLPATSIWTTKTVDVRFDEEPIVCLNIRSAEGSLRLDNLRLKKVF